MRAKDVLRDVMDTSESDVPIRGTPKDISSKEEKKILRRNQNSLLKRSEETADDIGALYSPNQLVDAIYSPTHFQDDPFLEEKGDGDESLLLETHDSVIQQTSEKRNPDNVLLRMYNRFTACVSVISVSPRRAVSLMLEENEMWDFNDWETTEYDDEREQLQRLTSWNTLETVGTSITNGSEKENGPTMTRKRTRRQSEGRKRIVQFDYPIISSLKECPRPDPRDLPNLYFTEEELGQIEDDRESTYTADDVEVVCVSSSQSSDVEDCQQSSNLPGHRRNGKPAKGPVLVEGNLASPRGEPARARSLSPSHSEAARKRHIKSVQIYLRERSREKSQRS
ncbi:hypothetical protein ACA910_012919 [Epithemia clementina (nom. ined.)]